MKQLFSICNFLCSHLASMLKQLSSQAASFLRSNQSPDCSPNPMQGCGQLKSTFSRAGMAVAPPVAWHGTPDPPVPSSPLSAQRRQSFWLTGASRSRDIKDPVVSDAIRGDQDGIGGLIQRRDVGSKWFWLIQIMELIPIIKDIYETELKQNQLKLGSG